MLLESKRAFVLVHRVLSLVYSAGHDEDDCNNESVKCESLSEDHHENEGNKDILLSVGTNTCITNNTNG